MGVSKPGSWPKFAFGTSGGTRFNLRVSWGDGFGLYSEGMVTCMRSSFCEVTVRFMGEE